MVSGFPQSHDFFFYSPQSKSKILKYFLLPKNKQTKNQTKTKQHIAEIICVIHLTASAPCRGAVAQSLWKRAGKAAVCHSTSPGCVQSVSKWRVPNPWASAGEMQALKQSSINEKWGKLRGAVLNLNFSVNCINGPGQVRRLHWTEINFTIKKLNERCRFTLWKADVWIWCNTKKI